MNRTRNIALALMALGAMMTIPWELFRIAHIGSPDTLSWNAWWISVLLGAMFIAGLVMLFYGFVLARRIMRQSAQGSTKTDVQK